MYFEGGFEPIVPKGAIRSSVRLNYKMSNPRRMFQSCGSRVYNDTWGSWRSRKKRSLPSRFFWRAAL